MVLPARGVGNNEEDTFTEMSCTNGGSGKNVVESHIAERGQLTNNSVEGSSAFESKEIWRVLKDAEAGSKLADDAEGIRPQPSVVSSSTPGTEQARRLARDASRKEVNKPKGFSQFRADVSHVAEVGHSGPPVFEDAACVGTDFGVGNGSESCPVGGKAKTSNPGEQIKVGGFIAHASFGVIAATAARFAHRGQQISRMFKCCPAVSVRCSPM